MIRSEFATCLLLVLATFAHAAPPPSSSASDDIAQTLLNAMKSENYPRVGKPGPSEYDKPAHVDARVIDKLAAFIAPAEG